MNEPGEQVGRMARAQGTPEFRISGAVDALKGYGVRLTTTEAAKVLNRTPRRIRAMIAEGSILGVLHGRDYLIQASEIQKVLNKRESKRARIESERRGKRTMEDTKQGLGQAGRPHGAAGETTKTPHQIEAESHPECATCRNRIESGNYTGPNHTPSPGCRSGKRPHCSCDFCY